MHGSALHVRTILLCATILLPVPMHAQTASASATVEKVVVTAGKLPGDLQQSPQSISVLTALSLDGAGINSLREATGVFPNVAMSGGIAGLLQGQTSIRGIASLVRNIGAESGVGVFVDGVYQGRPDTFDLELIDIAQIEVLRGPQGTIFGKNTIAGALNLTTVHPDTFTAGVANAEVGSYGLARFRGYLTGPLAGDKLAGKLALGYVRQDGVYRHLSGGPDGDALDLLSYRGSLYFTPSENTEFVLTIDGLHDRSRPAFFQVTDLAGPITPHARIEQTTPLTIDNNRPNTLNRDNTGVSLTGRQTFSFGRLRSVTAYRATSYDASLDDDQNQIDYAAIDRWGDDARLFTEDLRFDGTILGRTDYLLGFYYLDQTATTARALAAGADLGVPGEPLLTTIGSVRTHDYSVYGNVDYRATEALTASLGLRLSLEDRDADFTQGDPSGIYAFLGYPAIHYAKAVTNNAISPTASLAYQMTPDVMAYGRIARGFKSAAFNVDIVHSANGLAAGPEDATSYELGVKSELFGHRARLNAAVFHTDYNDLQVSQLLGTAIYLTNAAEAEVDGAEIEMEAHPAPGFELDLGLGALDARYRRFADCAPSASLGAAASDCAGKQMIGAPDWTFNAAAQYATDTPYGTVTMRLDYRFQSPVFFDATNSPRFESDSRNLFGARLGLARDNYDVVLWVKNLFDESYITYADDRSGLGVLRTTAYGAPRTFGLSMSLHY